MLWHLFRSKAAAADRVPLPSPFISDGGHAWVAPAPWPMPEEQAGWRNGFTTCLYEDGLRLLHAHTPHDTIRALGGGLARQQVDDLLRGFREPGAGNGRES